MYKILIAGIAASIGVAGWPDSADAELLSKTGPVIAIMGDDLFLGEAEGHLSGAGTIAIHSQRQPDVTCTGQFTSSAERGGLGRMRCSNGTPGTYRFKRMTLEKGYGTGSYGQRSMSFTYGLTPGESEPYLKLPPGKKLRHNGKELELVSVDKVRNGGVDGLTKSPLDKNRQGESNLQAFKRWFIERYHAVLALIGGALRKGD
jgi:hypothetical protein